MLKKKIDLRIDLDTRCNLRCHYCDNPLTNKDLKISLPINSIKNLFEFAEKNCWQLFLSCAGEPLMNPDFANIMQLLKIVKTPDVSMVTNALALNETNRKLILDSNINRLLISMDTLIPEIYTKWCGVNADMFTRVVDNIEAFAKAREKQKKQPHLIITAIAMRDTLDGLVDIAKWLKQLKVSAFNIQWLNSMNHDYLKKEQLDLNSPKVLAKVNSIFNEVQNILKGSSVKLDYPHTVNFEKFKSAVRGSLLYKNKMYYFKDLFAKLFFKRRHMPCRFAANTFYLWPDGHLKGCPADGFKTFNVFDNEHSLETEVNRVLDSLQKSFPENCKKCLFKVE